MKKLLLLICLLNPVAAYSQEDVVSRPDIRKDDSWTYRGNNMIGKEVRTYVVEVTFVNEKSIQGVTTVTDGQKIEEVKNPEELDQSWTREWNTMASHGGRLFSPHSGIFQFPLKQGKTYKIKYQMLSKRDGDAEFDGSAEVTVVGWETIDVPAGRFRVMKLHQVGTVYPKSSTSRAQPFEQELTMWYSPEVRRWVKAMAVNKWTRMSEELVSYRLVPR